MKNVTFLKFDFCLNDLPQHIRHFFIDAIDGYCYIQKKDNDSYEFRKVIYTDNYKDNDVLVEVITESVAVNIINYINEQNKKAQQKMVEKLVNQEITTKNINKWLQSLPQQINGFTRVDDVLVDSYNNVIFNLLTSELIFKPIEELTTALNEMIDDEENSIGD